MFSIKFLVVDSSDVEFYADMDDLCRHNYLEDLIDMVLSHCDKNELYDDNISDIFNEHGFSYEPKDEKARKIREAKEFLKSVGEL